MGYTPPKAWIRAGVQTGDTVMQDKHGNIIGIQRADANTPAGPSVSPTTPDAGALPTTQPTGQPQGQSQYGPRSAPNGGYQPGWTPIGPNGGFSNNPMLAQSPAWGQSKNSGAPIGQNKDGSFIYPSSQSGGVKQYSAQQPAWQQAGLKYPASVQPIGQNVNGSLVYPKPQSAYLSIQPPAALQPGGGGRAGYNSGAPGIAGDQSGLSATPGFDQQSPTATHRVDYPAVTNPDGSITPARTVWLTDEEYQRQQEAVAAANDQNNYGKSQLNPNYNDIEQTRAMNLNYDLMRALQAPPKTVDPLSSYYGSGWGSGWGGGGGGGGGYDSGGYSSSPYWAENLNTWNIS